VEGACIPAHSELQMSSGSLTKGTTNPPAPAWLVAPRDIAPHQGESARKESYFSPPDKWATAPNGTVAHLQASIRG
jgi:hypothetical protein